MACRQDGGGDNEACPSFVVLVKGLSPVEECQQDREAADADEQSSIRDQDDEKGGEERGDDDRRRRSR